jgi:sugar phosphate isomerase/epimerase
MLTTRREFLTLTLAGCASLALSGKLGAAARQPVGLQLYTLRDMAESDLPKTLQHIRDAGYDEVELYWSVYKHPAGELKKMLSDHGLKAPSGHFDYTGIESKLDYARELGLENVICPMLPKEQWNSADGFRQAAKSFNRWGAKVQNLGMKFGFHNHNYEFKKFDGKTGLEILMSETDPKLVQLEMDCYWVTQSGNDPVALMQKYKDRVRMLHIKDRKSGFATSQDLNESAEHFAEFGTGSINWAPIIAKAKQIGVKHYFVEQDVIEGDPIKSIKTSYDHARQML